MSRTKLIRVRKRKSYAAKRTTRLVRVKKIVKAKIFKVKRFKFRKPKIKKFKAVK